MTKINFLDQLKKGLLKLGVSDTEDIITDYATHFDNALLSGKTEDEISAELGSISDILSEFESNQSVKPEKNINNFSSIVVYDIFYYPVILSLYIFIFALFISVPAIIVMGIYLASMLDYLSIIPKLVFPFAQIMGIVFIIFSLLVFLVSKILLKWVNHLFINEVKRQKEMINGIPYEKHYLSIDKKIYLYIKWLSIGLLSLMILTYIIGIAMTKSAQFWEVWQWF
jgi:uncharacterized membrane protein